MAIAWIPLEEKAQVDGIVAQSATMPQVIFKHSTRYSISSIALRRLEEATPPPGVAFHYLDLIRHREVSNYVATRLDVWHESPQVIVVRNGTATYDESHMAIDMEEIAEQAVGGL